MLILIFKASLTSSNYLKTVSDIIIYWLGKYSLLLDFVMTKNKRGCIMNFPSENKITNLLFFSLEPIFNTIYGFLARIRRFLIFFCPDSTIILGTKMFGTVQPVYEIKCLSSGGQVVTPNSFSIFDSCDMKSLWFKFGHDIFTCFKILKLECPFSATKWNWRPLDLTSWPFEASEDIMTKLKSQALIIIKIIY